MCRTRPASNSRLATSEFGLAAADLDLSKVPSENVRRERFLRHADAFMRELALRIAELKEAGGSGDTALLRELLQLQRALRQVIDKTQHQAPTGD